MWFTVGWHPHQRHAPDAIEVRALEELLGHPRAVAVGEIGLDLYFRPGYHETPLDEQQRAMHTMMELAQTHAKPVAVHDRDAHAEVLEVILAHRGVRGVMHCFSGDEAFAQQCVDAGYAISFSGIVTFPRSEAHATAAAAVGEHDYVVETDSPFLAPFPTVDAPNLPGYVAATAAGWRSCGVSTRRACASRPRQPHAGSSDLPGTRDAPTRSRCRALDLCDPRRCTRSPAGWGWSPGTGSVRTSWSTAQCSTTSSPRWRPGRRRGARDRPRASAR